MKPTHLIQKHFIETGKALVESEHPQLKTKEVRALQSQLNTAANESPESPLLCLNFILDLVINDIFYNLSGDNGYTKIMDDVRDNVFMELGKLFLSIGTELPEFDSTMQWEQLNKLVTVYLSELDKLNVLKK